MAPAWFTPPYTAHEATSATQPHTAMLDLLTAENVPDVKLGGLANTHLEHIDALLYHLYHPTLRPDLILIAYHCSYVKQRPLITYSAGTLPARCAISSLYLP